MADDAPPMDADDSARKRLQDPPPDQRHAVNGLSADASATDSARNRLTAQHPSTPETPTAASGQESSATLNAAEYEVDAGSLKSDELARTDSHPSDATTHPDVDASGSSPSSARYEQPTVISVRPPVHAPSPHTPMSSRDLGQSLVGRRLAHFQLDEFVGGGGMGAVFRATDTMLHRTVAVKVLSRDQGRDEETVRRFKNEAQSAARLDHDNIARVYYVSEDDGWYFIVFEFIEGQNLREVVLQRGPLPWEQAVQITLQIAEALDHAAHRDVVHRDIKPSNVLLTPAGKAKLVDMGLARQQVLRGSVEDLTASGVTLGTFDYISPEQALDPRTADPRSDIYSLGCTLFYMLTGQPPFPDGTVLQKLLSHSNEAPPDPRFLRPELPAELTPIVHRMLAKQPNERYQRSAELIGDLLLLADRFNLPLQSRVEPIWIAPETTMVERVRPHLPWALAILLFVLAAIVLDPFLLDGGNDSAVQPEYVVPTALGTPPENGPNRRTIETNPADQPHDSGANGSRLPNAMGIESPRLISASADNSAEVPANATAKTATNHAASGEASSVRPRNPLDDAENSAATNGQKERNPAEAEKTSSTVNGKTTRGESSNKSDPDNKSPALPITASTDRSESSPTASQITNPTRVADRAFSGTAGRVPISGKSSDASTPSGNDAHRTLIVDASPMIEPEADQPLAANLQQGLEMAAEDPTIETLEIRHNGRLELSPLVINLPQRRLRLIAGPGYSPVLSFRTELYREESQTEAMVRIRGGEVEMRGLHWELIVPNEALGGEWCLFQLQQAPSIVMRDCTLTVQNSYGGRFSNLDDISFFRCVASPRIVRLNSDTPEARPSVRLEMTNCILRGEATGIQVREATPIQLIWKNGLLVTSERLLHLGGDRETPGMQERAEMRLQNVTAIADQGLVELTNTTSLPYLLPIAIDCQHCVLVTQRWYPLIAQAGISGLNPFMEQLTYSGLGNQYEGMEAFWKLKPRDAVDTESLDYDAWRNRFNDVQSTWQRVRWRYPPDKNRPLHEHHASDYALAPPNSAMPLSPEAVASGLLATDLPRLPERDSGIPRKTRPFFQY